MKITFYKSRDFVEECFYKNYSKVFLQENDDIRELTFPWARGF